MNGALMWTGFGKLCNGPVSLHEVLKNEKAVSFLSCIMLLEEE